MPYKDPEKQKEFQREWLQNRREKYLAGKKCEKCGSTKNLEIHHMDQDKKDEHRIWSWEPKRLEKELAKCKILCRKCHNDYHSELMRKKGSANFSDFSSIEELLNAVE